MYVNDKSDIQIRDISKMWNKLNNYLIILFVFGAQVCDGKFPPNKLETVKKFEVTKRSKPIQKDEYIPLNSITLNLFYNKNEPSKQLDSNTRKRWVKPKKKPKRKLKSKGHISDMNQNEPKNSNITLNEGASNKNLTTSKVTMLYCNHL